MSNLTQFFSVEVKKFCDPVSARREDLSIPGQFEPMHIG